MTTDKSTYLEINLDSVNEKMGYKGYCCKNQPVPIDYVPPLGDDLGYTSLELLLISLTSCICSTTGLLLRRNGKTISSIQAVTGGHRKEEHPTCFHTININLVLKSPDTTPEDVHNVLETIKEIAPVWQMLRQNVEIKTSVTVEKN